MSLQELLQQSHFPVIQAPMAGGLTSPAFIAAVCEAGALGSLGGGYLSPENLRAQIQEVRKRTSRPYSVNLFSPTAVTVDEKKIEASRRWLLPYHQELNIKAEPVAVWDPDLFEKQFQVVLEEKVPVFSFAFGSLSVDKIKALHAQKALVIGTATSLDEGRFLEAQGCDAVVAQGSEAGGHRGSFLKNEFPLVSLWDLLPALTSHLRIPVIAAGGIVNHEQARRARSMGAAAVQVGTAFLVCKESSAPSAYKQKLLTSAKGSTVLTKTFSGRWARGVNNRFMTEMKIHENDLPDYPLQNSLTQVLRRHAVETGNTDFMSLWAGEGVGELQERTLVELIGELTR